MKKTILTFSLFTLGLWGCSQQPAALVDVNIEEVPTLKMLYSEWPPDMIAYLAREKGIFQKNGLNVELVWVDGFEQAQLKRANGETDIWNYPLLDFLTEYAEGKERNAQVFLIQDFSAGADAIMVMSESGISSVADLKGKEVAVEKGTIGEFFLNILLNKESLALTDLKIIEASAEQVPNLLKEGKIAAGVTYEPYVSESIGLGGSILIDSSQERGTIVDVYVAKSEHIKSNQLAYQKLVKSLLEASEFYNKNPEEAAEIMKVPLNMSKEDLLATFRTFQIPDLRGNQTAFDRSSGFSSLFNLGKLAQKYLEEQGVLKSYFDLAPLINSELINSI